MANYTKLTPIKKAEILEAIARLGNISLVCKESGISREALYKHREKDKPFATAWAEALEQYTEKLEAEADRRAVEGVEKPVYQQGRRVGQVQEYSDTLLMFRLKALAPERYRERTEQRNISEPIDWDRVPAEIRDAFIAGTITEDDVRRSTKSKKR